MNCAALSAGLYWRGFPQPRTREPTDTTSIHLFTIPCKSELARKTPACSMFSVQLAQEALGNGPAAAALAGRKKPRYTAGPYFPSVIRVRQMPHPLGRAAPSLCDDLTMLWAALRRWLRPIGTNNAAGGIALAHGFRFEVELRLAGSHGRGCRLAPSRHKPPTLPKLSMYPRIRIFVEVRIDEGAHGTDRAAVSGRTAIPPCSASLNGPATGHRHTHPRSHCLVCFRSAIVGRWARRTKRERPGGPRWAAVRAWWMLPVVLPARIPVGVEQSVAAIRNRARGITQMGCTPRAWGSGSRRLRWVEPVRGRPTRGSRGTRKRLG